MEYSTWNFPIRMERISSLRKDASGKHVLGVDAEYLLDKLQIRGDGALDLPTICENAELFLRAMKLTIGVSSVLVFPGMPYVTRRLDGVISGFSVHDEGMMQYLMGRVKEVGVAMAMVAPYWSLAQLAYLLCPLGDCVTDIFGPVELLMFEFVDRVIIGIDPHEGSMRVVYRSDLEALYSGKIVSFFLDGGPPQSLFLGWQEGGYFDDVHRQAILNGVYHCPVMTRSGECVPLSLLMNRIGAPPCDLSQTFGRQLPPLLYYLHMHGLVSSDLAWSFAAAAIFDPGILATTVFTREHSRFIVPLRTQVVHQLARTFVEAPESFTMLWVRKDDVTPLRRPLSQTKEIILDEWIVPEVTLEKVTFHRVLDYASEAVVATPVTVRYSTPRAALCAIHLKSLDLLGYFTHGTLPGEEGSDVSVFARALRQWAHPDNELSEIVVLVIELQRTKSLESALSYIDVRDIDAQAERLILCISSLFPLWGVHWKRENLREIEELAGFQELVVSLHRGLRVLVEAIAAGVIAKNFPGVTNSFPMSSFAASLPFFRPTTTHAAVVMDYVLSMDSPAMSVLVRQFAASDADLADVRRDVGRLMNFVSDALTMVHHVMQVEDQEARIDGYGLALAAAGRVMEDRKRALGL